MEALKLAYVLHRFPKLSETFIIREISYLRAQGMDVTIFSLLSPKQGPIHSQVSELLPYVRYSPMFSWSILKSQLYFIRKSPTCYLLAFANTVAQIYRTPKTLLLGLALFPKSVHFARQMELLNVRHVHAHFAWLGGIAAGVTSELLGIS